MHAPGSLVSCVKIDVLYSWLNLDRDARWLSWSMNNVDDNEIETQRGELGLVVAQVLPALLSHQPAVYVITARSIGWDIDEYWKSVDEPR